MRRNITWNVLAATAVALSWASGTGGGGGEAADLPGPKPFPITDSMLASGQHYELNCVPSHGPEGKGDGPSASSLDPATTRTRSTWRGSPTIGSRRR